MKDGILRQLAAAESSVEELRGVLKKLVAGSKPLDVDVSSWEGGTGNLFCGSWHIEELHRVLEEARPLVREE